MKIALLGNGKTGGKVHDVIADNDSVTDFNEQTPPTVEAIQEHDVVICFLPGDAFAEYFEMLIEARVPVVTGSTGFDWPDDTDQKLKAAEATWIYANNFSLGMQLIHDALVAICQSDALLPDAHYSIHEIHHVHKKDKPSGTALKWQEWVGKQSEITSERTGDVVGDHTLTIETPSEKIVVQHVAKDRSLFASGAVWAARQITDLSPGLHAFEDVIAKAKGDNS